MKYYKSISLAFVCLLAAATLLGFKKFSLTYQAWGLWEVYGHDLLGPVREANPHALRYFIYYPLFLASEVSGVAVEDAFSAISILNISTIIFMVAVTLGIYVEPHKSYLVMVASAAIILISMYMNGRMIIAFMGYAMIIYSGVFWFVSRRAVSIHVAACGLGCFLCGVSSGTIVAAMLLIAGFAYVVARHGAGGRDSCTLYISIGSILAIFAAPALIGFAGNLAFYGGDAYAIVRMVHHGFGGALGRILPYVQSLTASQPTWVLFGAAFATAAGGIFFIFVTSRFALRYSSELKPDMKVIILSILLPICGGVFGYSVLTLAIIPAIMLAVIVISSGFASLRIERTEDVFD